MPGLSANDFRELIFNNLPKENFGRDNSGIRCISYLNENNVKVVARLSSFNCDRLSNLYHKLQNLGFFVHLPSVDLIS